MANGRFRPSGWTIAIVVVVVVASVFVALQLFPSNGALGGGATPSSQDGAPFPNVPTPSSIDVHDEQAHDDDIEPHSHEVDEFDCLNFMDQREYDALMKRVYEFEVISQMQASQDRLNRMVPYATEGFLETHKGFQEDVPVNDVRVDVSPESSMGCLMEKEGELLARITPLISTVLTNQDGSEEVLQGPLRVATHYTYWVLIDGQWFVDQEEN